MLTIALALGASLSWGFADFFGPLKGRTLGALRVLLYAQLGGLVAIAIAVTIRGEPPASATALLAVPAAMSGTLGLYAYYRGIAVGAVSVVAPIAGVSAAIPVVVGVISGERPSVWQGVGMAAALAGVFLASREPDPRGGRIAAGVGLALLAAVGFGGYFPFMHAAGNTDYWWASLIFRITSTTLVLIPALARRTSLAVAPRRLWPLALVGLGDMFGNLLYAASSAYGLVSVTAVLASLYPIVTVALARVALAERVARSQ